MTIARSEDAVEYATHVTRLLWPEPWQEPQLGRWRQAQGGGCREFYVFPRAGRPRLLMPAGVFAAASMLNRLGKGNSPISRAGRRILVRLASSRAFPLFGWPTLRIAAPAGAEPDSIDGYLATVFQREVRVGIVLGTPRVNQKPVLQVFAADGELLGYAKVGHNELTAMLVRQEADTLAMLGGYDTKAFRPPRLLHSGQWNGLEVLVMSALTGGKALQSSDTLRRTAMCEVASLRGTTSCPLSRSAFWSRVRNQVREVHDPDLHARLCAGLATIVDRWGETVVVFGAWHGDWGHWNMALTDDIVQLWDWERYDAQVPLGFDALHYAAQIIRPGERSWLEQEERFLDNAPDVLRQVDVAPQVAGLTLTLYLLEISIRYALSLDFASTPALQRRCAWSLGLLEGQLTRITEDEGGQA